jgi:hypothetical protein
MNTLNYNNIYKKIIIFLIIIKIIIQIIQFLKWILLIIINIIILITQVIVFRNPKPKSIGSYGRTKKTWVQTQDSRALGPETKPKVNWFCVWSAQEVVTHFLTLHAGDSVYLFWIECRSLTHVCWKIDKNRERNIFLKPCLSCFLLSLSFFFAVKIVRFS